MCFRASRIRICGALVLAVAGFQQHVLACGGHQAGGADGGAGAGHIPVIALPVLVAVHTGGQAAGTDLCGHRLTGLWAATAAAAGQRQADQRWQGVDLEMHGGILVVGLRS